MESTEKRNEQMHASEAAKATPSSGVEAKKLLVSNRSFIASARAALVEAQTHYEQNLVETNSNPELKITT